MSQLTNSTNICLPFAVMLATDKYDMEPASNKVSVTSLLRPVRQLILSDRIAGTPDELPNDIAGTIASRIGTAIHDALEKSWQQPQAALKALGYPQRIIDRIRINPEEVDPNYHNIWTEIRTEKEFNGFIVSGCADLIIENSIQDYKTTRTFTYVNQTKMDDYIHQLSIYRWLNQDKVKEDIGKIHFYFTDYSAMNKYQTNYPTSQILTQDIPLLSIPATENLLSSKLNLLKQHWNTPEPELPNCTQKELWQDKPKYQYFAKADSKRASKNFDSQVEAEAHKSSKGKGEVRYKPAKVKACNYCAALPICSQAARLRAQGLLD